MTAQVETLPHTTSSSCNDEKLICTAPQDTLRGGHTTDTITQDTWRGSHKRDTTTLRGGHTMDTATQDTWRGGSTNTILQRP